MGEDIGKWKDCGREFFLLLVFRFESGEGRLFGVRMLGF